MCGIIAIHSPSQPVSHRSLECALDALAHRGPDGATTWVSPHARVGLGHRRLAIIDLVTGEQPLANEDGTLRFVVNGEFYDYERIRDELINNGHVFRTQSDSEIAVHLYE